MLFLRRIILFLLFPFAVLSQTSFNRAYHDRYEEPFPYLFEINGDYYFMTQGWDIPVGNIYLYKHTSSGALAFRKALFQTPGTKHIGSVFKTLDNSFMCIGWYDGCDETDTSYRSFISKVLSDGTVQFYTPVKTKFQIVNFFNDNLRTGLQHTDSSYYAFTDSVMYHFSKSGQYLSKSIGLGITNITSALLLPDSNILLSAKINSVSSLVKISPSGSIISQSTVPVLFSRLSFYGNQNILGLAQNLYKISPTFSVISNSSLPAGEGIFNYQVLNDTVYTVGSNSDPVYRIMDTSFNSISQTTTSTGRVGQYGIAVKNNFTAILNSANSSTVFSANNTFSGLNVFPKFQSNNFTHDAQVLRVEADSTQALLWNNPPIPAYLISLRANVCVRNNGSLPLTSVKLNSFIQYNIACGSTYYQHSCSGFTVQPGDSVILNTGWISKNLSGGYGYSPTVQFCIYTTLPDSANDRNISNDGICRNFTFHIDGLQDYSPGANRISVFPNPFKNSISIECNQDIEKISLYDIRGKLLREETISAKNAVIDLNELAAGMYILRCKDKSGTVNRKIIRE